MRMIIAGGRDFNDFELLSNTVDDLFHNRLPISTIISGTAKGADTLGAEYAKKNGIYLKEYYPDWQQHGKKAGILRNITMADNAELLLAFWNGESKGTNHMINIALKKSLFVKIIRY